MLPAAGPLGDGRHKENAGFVCLNVGCGLPVVTVGCSFWTGIGIFQQSVSDSRPNNVYSFLMFLVAGLLVYMLACTKLMWDVVMVCTLPSGWLWSTCCGPRARFSPLPHAVRPGLPSRATGQGEIRQWPFHMQRGPSSPFTCLTPLPLLPLLPPRHPLALKGPWCFFFLLAHHENTDPAQYPGGTSGCGSWRLSYRDSLA